MIITCGQCRTKFRVNPGLIKPTGSRVRCSSCQAIFTVFSPLPGELPEEPAAPPPRRPAAGPARDRSAEALDRELEGLIDDQGLDGDDYQPPRPASPPRVAARPPHPAGNNPITLIKGNGDSFTVDGAELTPRPVSPTPRPVPPSWPRAEAASSTGPLSDEHLPGGPDSSSPRGPFDLGLGEDPMTAAPQGAAFRPPLDRPDQPDQPSAPTAAKPLRDRSSTGFSPAQKKLLLGLSIVAAFLVVCILLLFLRPGDDSLVAIQPVDRPAGEPAAEGDAGGQPAGPDDGPADALNLIFAKEKVTHHYFENAGAGQILVITGRIINGNKERISQIRVKGVLKNGAGAVASERQVFAGNILTEEELKTLPMKEILARLALRGGQNGANLNIPTDKAVPFMLVFDKLPPDLAEYLVEPISYVPASEALSSVQGQ